jgi:AcrR family transcriptional regulator
VAALPEPLQSLPVGRRQLPREVMAAHQRDRVLDAAVEVFAKRGYPATTVDHIVAAAKIGVGSFYALFDGKQDCFLKAYDRVVTVARERIAAQTPPDAPWPEAVCSALHTLLELIAAEPFRARLVFAEAQTAGAAAEARYEATLSDAVSAVRRGRSLSPLSAELPPTFEDATLAGLAWLIHQRLLTAEPQETPALFSDMAEIVLEPYLGEAEAARVIAASSPAPALAP